jgi:hypothetical protein
VQDVGGGHGVTVPGACAPFSVEISNVAFGRCEDRPTTSPSADSREAAAARARRDADAIRRIGAALMARQREIGRAITARIVDELPEYRDATEQLQADLLVGATEAAGLLAGSFAGGRALQRQDAAGVRELAARRVHQGLDLDVFLHAYRVALFAFWDACTEEAERLRLPRSAGYALARTAIEAIDVVTTQAAEGFLREEARVRTRSGREARDLVERLVGGRAPDARRRHPAAPGLDPAATLVVVVGRVEPGDQSPGDALLVARDVVAEGLRPPLIALRHDELVAITRTVRDADLLALQAVALTRGVDVRFGLGLPAAGFAGVERAYREAALCLAWATPTRPVVLLADLPALETAMVGADATARAVIAAKGTGLRALDPTERARAIDTIRAFAAADLNVARAAIALHVHQNTVRDRLSRINAATGHNPRTFRGLVDLLCAVETLRDGPSPAA